ncbi:LysM peptidoglycan-binding domain-containing protein [Salinicola endophyticus]|uniref:LysM peptidoglycan-binding domain-containing protein n=1 Tax=Salinicola endophyticus TaxID=1949083 RepID=UPI00165F6837|nr:LysM domain-containing protein [Salinicola endophyticus]
MAISPRLSSTRFVRRLASSVLVGALLLFTLAGPGAVPALAYTLKPDAPSRYQVRPGDTLWGVAARFLEDPWSWRELLRRNPGVAGPEQLYPGDVLVLKTHAGEPSIGVERARGGTVRLSPQVRRAPVREALPSLPLERVRVFLKAYRIVDPALLASAPQVVAGQGGRLLSGAGDRLYAQGRLPPAGTRLGIYRAGDDYRDPADGTPLGRELQRLGEARVVQRHDDVSELEVLDAGREIRAGDTLLTLDDGGITTEFVPRAPTSPVTATLLAVPGGVRFIGRDDVVAIDRGRADGLEPGHVLQVMRQGERVRAADGNGWIILPDHEAGAVMVFRVFDHLAYALVMRASEALAVGDRLTTPQALGASVARTEAR